MTYLIAITESGETADGRYKLVPVTPPLELGVRGAALVNSYDFMLSAASIDVAGMAVKVPERRALRATDGIDACNACWNDAIDALGIKP